MDLVHEMTYHAMLRPPMPVGDGPFGTRMFFDVIEGRVEGSRFSGNFKGGGGDWLLAGTDGFGRLDESTDRNGRRRLRLCPVFWLDRIE